MFNGFSGLPSATRRWGWILVPCVGFLWFAFQGLPKAIGQSQTAFVVDYVEVSTSLVSGRSARRDMYYAKRADGAFVKGLSGARFNRRDIVLPIQKLGVSLSDSEHVKSTFDYSSRLLGNLQSSPLRHGCVLRDYEELGTEEILGLHSNHYRAVRSAEDGTTVEMHRWLAPSLACYELRNRVYRRNKEGDLIGEFEKRPTRVTVGEPDAQLFSIGPSYMEVPPSEFEVRVLRSKIREDQGPRAAADYVIPQCVQNGLALKDQKYHELKKP